MVGRCGIASTRDAHRSMGVKRCASTVIAGMATPSSCAALNTVYCRRTQRTYTGTRGSLCRPDRDFPVFVRWYKRGQLDLDALVTQRYTLDQINDAVADLSGGHIHGRSIIMYT